MNPLRDNVLMLRVFGIALFVGVGASLLCCVVFPFVVLYTLQAGEKVTVQVERCREDRGYRSVHECRGTWRTADGREESGHVSGVDPTDIGQDVNARTGPLGPYATRADSMFFPAMLWLPPIGTIPLMMWLRRWERKAEAASS